MRAAFLLPLIMWTMAVQAEEARKVIHDGTEMAMTKTADGLEIVYGADIPAELRELGVTPGTMLIRGRWEESTLVGEAWAFSADCKSVAYPVFGVVDNAGALVVFGPVPRTCKAGGDYSWGKQAVMRFDQPVPAVRAERREKAKPKPKSEPKPKARPQRRPQQPQPQQPQQPQQYWPTYPQWWR